MLTKEEVVAKLLTDDNAVIWALRVLNRRQTSDEQRSEQTKYHNCQGFRPCHARMGTSMATFFERRGFLSPKQIAYWRKTDKSGAMRIAIYWKQIAEEIEARKAKKDAAAVVQVAETVQQLNPVLDSFMEKVRGVQNDLHQER